MASPKSTATPHAFRVYFNRQGEYHTLLVDVFALREDGTLNYSRDTELHGFGFKVQADRTKTDFYAWESAGNFLADGDRVSLRDAERMVKVLKRVNRKLADLETRFGPVADFAEHIARCADALGITTAREKRDVHGSTWDNENYRTYTIPELVSKIRAEQADWTRLQQKAEVA
jgi:hypothetical protein